MLKLHKIIHCGVCMLTIVDPISVNRDGGMSVKLKKRIISFNKLCADLIKYLLRSTTRHTGLLPSSPFLGIPV